MPNPIKAIRVIKKLPKGSNKKIVKVNSNPNKTSAKGTKNPSKQMLDEYEMDKELYKRGLGSNPQIKKQTVKIKSSIPKRRGK